ncbi:MAG TPA: hypothetical protein VLG38_05235, partial [Gammaproteobacteria bacterium]|nr:hypothetical protein [Gammaproteobacteria bacterium]
SAGADISKAEVFGKYIQFNLTAGKTLPDIFNVINPGKPAQLNLNQLDNLFNATTTAVPTPTAVTTTTPKTQQGQSTTPSSPIPYQGIQMEEVSTQRGTYTSICRIPESALEFFKRLGANQVSQNQNDMVADGPGVVRVQIPGNLTMDKFASRNGFQVQALPIDNNFKEAVQLANAAATKQQPQKRWETPQPTSMPPVIANFSTQATTLTPPAPQARLFRDIVTTGNDAGQVKVRFLLRDLGAGGLQGKNIPTQDTLKVWAQDGATRINELKDTANNVIGYELVFADSTLANTDAKREANVNTSIAWTDKHFSNENITYADWNTYTGVVAALTQSTTTATTTQKKGPPPTTPHEITDVDPNVIIGSKTQEDDTSEIITAKKETRAEEETQPLEIAPLGPRDGRKLYAIREEDRDRLIAMNLDDIELATDDSDDASEAFVYFTLPTSSDLTQDTRFVVPNTAIFAAASEKQQLKVRTVDTSPLPVTATDVQTSANTAAAKDLFTISIPKPRPGWLGAIFGGTPIGVVVLQPKDGDVAKQAQIFNFVKDPQNNAMIKNLIRKSLEKEHPGTTITDAAVAKMLTALLACTKTSPDGKPNVNNNIYIVTENYSNVTGEMFNFVNSTAFRNAALNPAQARAAMTNVPTDEDRRRGAMLKAATRLMKKVDEVAFGEQTGISVTGIPENAKASDLIDVSPLDTRTLRVRKPSYLALVVKPIHGAIKADMMRDFLADQANYNQMIDDIVPLILGDGEYTVEDKQEAIKRANQIVICFEKCRVKGDGTLIVEGLPTAWQLDVTANEYLNSDEFIHAFAAHMDKKDAALKSSQAAGDVGSLVDFNVTLEDYKPHTIGDRMSRLIVHNANVVITFPPGSVVTADDISTFLRNQGNEQTLIESVLDQIGRGETEEEQNGQLMKASAMVRYMMNAENVGIHRGGKLIVQDIPREGDMADAVEAYLKSDQFKQTLVDSLGIDLTAKQNAQIGRLDFAAQLGLASQVNQRDRQNITGRGQQNQANATFNTGLQQGTVVVDVIQGDNQSNTNRGGTRGAATLSPLQQAMFDLYDGKTWTGGSLIRAEKLTDNSIDFYVLARTRDGHERPDASNWKLNVDGGKVKLRDADGWMMTWGAMQRINERSNTFAFSANPAVRERQALAWATALALDSKTGQRLAAKIDFNIRNRDQNTLEAISDVLKKPGFADARVLFGLKLDDNNNLVRDTTIPNYNKSFDSFFQPPQNTNNSTLTLSGGG